jgi:hypothetical protein
LKVFGKTVAKYPAYSGSSFCRSEPARDKPKGAAHIQDFPVTVGVFREQSSVERRRLPKQTQPRSHTMKTPALLLTLTSLATQAHASSPDAWAAFDKAVLASCTKASQLSHAKPVGNAAQFDDRVGYTAMLLQGQYPQKHMKGQTGTELCLYHKKSKTAYVTEWDSVRATGKGQ